VKTTFDLPDPLLRKAKALAAHQGKPLRDVVAEALAEKLSSATRGAGAAHARTRAWKEYSARLKRLPDGTLVNPEGVDDPAFFAALDEARRQAWTPRDPFAHRIAEPPAVPTSKRRRR
jgi:hypothetical protein